MLENFLLNGTVDMTAANLFICTACSAVLGVCLAAVHRYKNSASRSFLMTLILLPVIVQMVIMCVCRHGHRPCDGNGISWRRSVPDGGGFGAYAPFPCNSRGGR